MNDESESPVEETDAYKTLLAKVGRRSPKVPADLLTRHVLEIVPVGEFPTRVEAMEAVVRRVESIKKDELRLAGRPADGEILGRYSTKRRGADSRPYQTSLRGVDPIEGRCDCPDFLKSSLGLCKHILVILEHIYAKPRLLARAIKEQSLIAAGNRIGLNWNPIRPLTGPGDWLENVDWHRSMDTETRTDRRSTEALKSFRKVTPGVFRLRQTYLDAPEKRLKLIDLLLRILGSSTGRTFDDPSLSALLKAEKTRLKRVVDRRLTPAECKAAFKGLKRTLYPYQQAGVERFLSCGRLLLADDMGLGKTAQAISSIDILWRTQRIRRGLIIAPASLKPQWAREWASFSDLPIHVIDGSPGERQALYESKKSGLFIINYEQLLRDLDIIRKWSPDVVVLDEAQRIKNWATKTAISVKGLNPTYRLVLTGTPMENRIEELASVVEWVDDRAMEPKWRLSPFHAVHVDGRTEVAGVRHLDTLRERLKGCMLRRIRRDVLDQLPPRTDVRVPIELTEPQAEEHDALIQPIAALVARAKVRPLTQPEFLRLMSLLTTQRIISNGLAQLQFEDVWPAIRTRMPEDSVIKGLSSPKLAELRQLVRQLVIDQGRKLVIFSQWRRMLALSQWAVRDILSESGLRAGFFTGAEGQKRRTQNIVEFHDDPNFRILFASDAGGVGLNLQHASNCVINLELPWNPAVLEQRIGRVYRLGQKLPIDVYNLVCEEGIESRIADLVGSKQALFKGLFDSESETVLYEQSGSFLSRVEKLYEAEVGASASVVDDLEIGEVEPIDDVTDPFEDVLESADETTDAPPAALETATVESKPMIEELPSETKAVDVRRLFAQLTIERTPTGTIRIEAPPEAASALSALFEGMAMLLQSASSSSRSE